MWEAIEMLQQGESLNIQDVMKNLFWEFSKFTSHDGETMESYYTRFVTIVKQQQKLDEVSYHKLFEILKQYEKEVNKLRAKRIARNANPLALVATAQPNQDPYYQTSKPHKPYAPTSEASIPTRSHATTRNKGKDIAEPITPLSESDSKEDSDPEQAQRDKDMQKIWLSLQKQSDWLADTDEEIDEQELETHHSYMEKIQEVPTADSGTDSKPLEQVQYNDKYNVFSNVHQYCEQSESTSNKCLVEKDDSDVTPDSPDMYEHDIQSVQNAEDECDALINLIANLKLDCKSILAETSKTLEESNSVRDSCLVTLQTKQTEFEKYKACNDRTVDYDKIKLVKEKHVELVKQSLLTKSHYEGLVKEKIKVITDLKQKEDIDIDKMISMEKQLQFLNEIVYKRNLTIQTIHILAPKDPTLNGRPTFTNPMYLKKAQSEKPCLYVIPNDQFDPTNRLVPDREETLTLAEEIRSKLNKDFMRPYDYTKLNSLYEIFKPAPQGNHKQLVHANETKSVPKTNVSEGLSKPATTQNLPQTARKAYKSNQMKENVMPNNSQVKLKKIEVKDHPRIPSISNKTKFVTACNDSLNSITSNVNAVCATCGKYLVDSNHFVCVTKMLNDVNARTKKPNVVPNSTRKPKGHANKSVATPLKKKVASKTTTQKPRSYYRMLYEKTSKTWKWWIEQQCPSGYKWVPKIKSKWVPKQKRNGYISSIQQELDLLFGPLYDEFFNACTLCVNKSSSPIDNSKQRDTPPTTNIQSSTEPTNTNAEENNKNKAEHEFINPLCTPVQEVAESSSHNIEQVHGNPSKPVQTRRQLVTDPKMCIFALTVSTAEAKNIKEVMADSAWIEVM
uniref:Gag-Pol polyprotein n=1 Tax=Tanacetum cinerariifolium TaxID=118510 RepID=A0A6L2P113_TANCI|nr:hypothetical protein [Tanacetum cinerariifolium]